MDNSKMIPWLRMVLLVLISSADLIRRSQAAVCPASLYFYAAETTDDREIFLRVNASNFEDCVKKCYSSDFCFSAVYTPRPGDTADCRLSYVAAYNCSHKVLINTYSNPNRPATAECIRCPALGEFISPPVTVQPNGATAGTNAPATTRQPIVTAAPSTETTKLVTVSVYATEKGTDSTTPVPTVETTKVTTKAEITTETNLQLTFEVDEISAQELRDMQVDVNNFTDVKDVSECAKLCYEKKCIFSVFAQSRDEGRCYLNFNGTQVCTGKGRVSSYSPQNQPYVLVHCPFLKSVIIEPPPTSVTKPQTEVAETQTTAEATTVTTAEVTTTTANAVVTAEQKTCDKVLTFNVLDPPRKASTDYTNHTEAVSVADCARQCYTSGCTIAGFASSIEAHSVVGSCLMSFTSDDCNAGKTVTSYNAVNGPVQIQCVKCQDAAPTSGTTQAPEDTCSSTISFGLTLPKPEMVSHFTNVTIVRSSVECAYKCFHQKCTIAGYIPISSTSGNCMLSFDTTYRCNQTNVNRTTNYTENEATLLTCLRCETTVSSNPTESTARPPLPACTESVTFEAKEPGSDRVYHYSETLSAANAQECAQLCYQKRCTHANYVPDRHSGGSKNSCSLGYFDEMCNSNVTRTSSYSGKNPIEFHCVRCGEAVIVQPPIVIPINPTQIIPATTTPTATEAPSTAEQTTTVKKEMTSEEAITTAAAETTVSNETTTELTKASTAAETTVREETTAASNETTAASTTQEVTTKETTEKESTKTEASATTKGTTVNLKDIVQDCEDPVGFSVLQPDINREIPFVRTSSVEAESVADCARLCWQRNCSVAGFVPSGLMAFCIFAFNINSNCSNLDTFTTYNTSTSVQIQCLTCSHPKILSVIEATPGLVTKEVTAQSTVTEATPGLVTKEVTAQGTVTEAQTTGLASLESKETTEASTGTTKEVSENIKSVVQSCEDPVTFTVFPPDIHVPLLQSLPVHADDVESCAKQCFERNCSVAGFLPSGSACLFAFDFAHNCSNVDRYSVYNSSTPVQIQCLDCKNPKILSVIEATPGVITKEVTNEGTVTAQTTTTVAGTSESNAYTGGGLSKMLCSWQGSESAKDRDRNYTETVASSTVQDCARLCDSKKCSHAQYVPDSSEGSNSSCFLGYTNQVCKSDVSGSTEFHGLFPLDLDCIKCATVEVTETTLAAVETTSQSSVLLDCIVSFQMSDINSSINESSYYDTPAVSTSHCARSCYLDGCTVAHYKPGSPKGMCRMFYEPVESFSSCKTNRDDVLTHKTKSPVQIQCLRCINASAIGKNINSTKNKTNLLTTITKRQTTVAVIGHESTVPPVVRNCQGILKYEATTVQPQEVFVHDFNMTTSNFDGCATLCYQRTCSSALYAPSTGDCRMSFRDFVCPRQPSLVYRYESDDSAILKCFTCVESASSPAPPSNTSETTVANKLITHPTVRSCEGILKFELTLVHPEENFSNDFNLTTSNADECALLCYRRLCTSVLFLPTSWTSSGVSSGDCRMSFNGSDCPRRAVLISTTKSLQTVLLKCFACDESTSGGSWSFSTESAERITDVTIEAATTQISAENQTETTTISSVSKQQFGNGCQGILNFYVSDNESQLSTTNYESSVEQSNSDSCVKYCYERGCKAAAFFPMVAGNGKCWMNFTDNEGCPPEAHLLNHYESVNPVSFRCLTCVAAVIEATPGSVEKTNVTYPQQGLPDCHSVAFEPVHPDSHKFSDFSNHSFAFSASECALRCYSNGCSVAGFQAPTPATSEPGVCILSFGNPSCSGSAKISEHKDGGNIQIQCVECLSSGGSVGTNTGVSAEVTTISPSNVSVEITTLSNENTTIAVVEITTLSNENTTVVAVEITTVSNETSLVTSFGTETGQSCARDLFYQVTKPTTLDAANKKQVTVGSAQECAQACYGQKCSKALYTPSTGKPTCDLIFDSPVDCSADRPYYVWQYQATEAVQIQCITCSNLNVPLQDENAKLATVTAQDVYNQTKLEVDQSKPDCAVIYEEREIKRTTSEADFISNVETVSDCAKDCYVYGGCTEAHFIPVVQASNQTSRCLLFFSTSRNCSDSPKFAYRKVEQPVLITCVSCIQNLAGYLAVRNKGQQTPGEIIDQPTVVVEKTTRETSLSPTTNAQTEVTTVNNAGTVSENETTTLPPSLNYTRVCNTNITFEVVSNPDDDGLTYTTDSYQANNGYECAMECYKRGCNLANFAIEDKNTGKASRCVFSFDTDICQPKGRTAASSDGKAIRLQCIKCVSLAIEPPVESTTLLTTTVATENVTELESTARYVTGGGFEPNTNSSELLPTAAGVNGPLATTIVTISESFPTLAVFANESTSDEVTSAFPTLASFQTATVLENIETTNASITTGSTCGNRVTFQVQPAATDWSAFTNSQKAYSASDCAKMCYSTNCEVAAYIPTPDTFQAGVCLMSNKKRECSSTSPKVPQEYRTYPFILNCIECSPCSFNLRTPDPNKTPNYDVQEKADSMIECAQKCAQNKCSSAAYTGRTSGGTCLIDTKSEKQCQAVAETRVETNDNLPVIIDCVQCNA